MSQLTIPKNFGQISQRLTTAGSADELGAGIQSGLAVVGYRGKSWSIKFGGTEHPMLRADDGTPKSAMDFVIVKAASTISKLYYPQGYVEGSTAKPDCWSIDGVKPDRAVATPQHSNCANCPHNQWGARVTDAGKQGKACQDHKRLAVVPLDDIDNEVYGGPMLLRVPAASLKTVKEYGDKLNQMGWPFYAIGTRITFGTEAYPKFVLTPVRALDDAEADKIAALREDPRVARILNESAIENDGAPEEDPFAKLPPPPPKAVAKRPTDTVKMQPKPAPVIEGEVVDEETGEITPAPKPAPKPAVAAKPAPKPESTASEVSDLDDDTGAKAPASFDAMLDDLL